MFVHETIRIMNMYHCEKELVEYYKLQNSRKLGKHAAMMLVSLTQLTV